MKKKEILAVLVIFSLLIIVGVLGSIVILGAKNQNRSTPKPNTHLSTQKSSSFSGNSNSKNVETSEEESSDNKSETTKSSSTEENNTISVSEDTMESVGRNFINSYYPSTNKQYHDKAVSLQPYATDSVINGLIPNALNRTESDIDIYSYVIGDIEFKNLSNNKISADVPVKEVMNGQGAISIKVHFEFTFDKAHKIGTLLKDISY